VRAQSRGSAEAWPRGRGTEQGRRRIWGTAVGAEWGRGTAALVQAPDQRELLDGWEAEFMAWWQVEEARAEAQRPHAGAGSEGGVEPPPDVVRAVMGLGVAEVIGGVAVGLR